MSMDGFGTPQDILATQPPDQHSHFLADGWTASFPPRFPAPPLEKGKLMPLQHGLGLLLLQTEQPEEMTKGGDGVVNGGEIDLLGRSSFWER